MKTIAVFIHSLTIEYALDVLYGITSYFKDKDVRLVIVQTKQPHVQNGVYTYHCWEGAEYAFSEQIDAYIIISGSYASLMSIDSLIKSLEKTGDRPVISIGTDLSLKNSYTIKIDCKNAYSSVIKHLVNKHNCKKIAFMSADITISPEAKDRYEAYKAAMAANNLPFDEDLILWGNFTRSSALKAMEDKYKRKEDVPFDAILCANDLMATGIQIALQQLGISIPDEIKVFGFDETSHATAVSPRLSTIDQNIFQQGFYAGKTALEILSGEVKKSTVYIPVEIIYRQSCGCVPLDVKEDVYFDSEGNRKIKTTDKQKMANNSGRYANFLEGIENIYNLSDMAQSATTMIKTFYTMGHLLQISAMDTLAVCLFDEKLQVHREDDFIIPEKIRLSMDIKRIPNSNEMKHESVYEPGTVFDPHKIIFPDSRFLNQSGTYLLEPIFSGEFSYGYILCRLNSENYSIYTVLCKVLINTLAKSYEYTQAILENDELHARNNQLLADNSTLDMTSKTDELTKILNRRGFMEYAQNSIDFAVKTGITGVVIFADMDGLKIINDSYGHETGDSAIKALSSALKKSFRVNDVVGRLSGDEFGIVATGLEAKNIPIIRQKIEKNCEIESANNNLPFTVSCSIGYVVLSNEESNLRNLLTKADELLYVEKREKKLKKLNNNK